ncbi:MAG: hypothetical protein QOG49_1097 [Frankiaceae bacterium]|nr:hypothetical protein [Frankiaceae bacterium]
MTPSSAYVEVTDTELRARYGYLSMATPLANVASAEETGPYKAYRSLGPRLSLADRGATFGTGVHGVCIRFHEPVKALTRFAIHPGLTVTVADRSGLVAALGRYPRPADAS